MAGVAAKALLGGEGSWLPLYFTFLLLTAYLPLILFWGSVRPLVHWQALSFTVLYTLVTSIVWELSLGLPLQWWGYQKSAMMGLWVQAWQRSVRADLPVEAVSVWLVAPFAAVFFFEIIRALHYHPAKGLRGKLFGPRREPAGGPGSPANPDKAAVGPTESGPVSPLKEQPIQAVQSQADAGAVSAAASGRRAPAAPKASARKPAAAPRTGPSAHPKPRRKPKP
jgi:hypothetical protein